MEAGKLGECRLIYYDFLEWKYIMVSCEDFEV